MFQDLHSHSHRFPSHMSTESPFTIAVPDEQILLLKQKLELARFPDELEEAGWSYGAPLKDVQRLAAYWKDGFDWRKHEALLNEELPQFTRDVEVEGFGSLNIHYVHKKSSVDSAIPLLFVHGCEYLVFLSYCLWNEETILTISYRAWKLFGS